jgi:hypothetical protein
LSYSRITGSKGNIVQRQVIRLFDRNPVFGSVSNLAIHDEARNAPARCFALDVDSMIISDG